jgi:uncharacterized protein (TIGR00730 family)
MTTHPPGASSTPAYAEFLGLDETRGVRLQLEYLEVELALKKAGVRHTVAVFGSTRTPLADRHYEEARRFGALVARAGGALVTGGGPGIMEAANRGAFEAGGASIGMNIALPREQAPNHYLTPGLSFHFRYFALRKLHFLLRARALVAFPGGFGTIDELFETLMLVQTGKIQPLPVVLVCAEWWRRAVDFDYLAEEGVIAPGDRQLFSYAADAEAAWRTIEAWYAASGARVFPAT